MEKKEDTPPVDGHYCDGIRAKKRVKHLQNVVEMKKWIETGILLLDDDMCDELEGLGVHEERFGIHPDSRRSAVIQYHKDVRTQCCKGDCKENVSVVVSLAVMFFLDEKGDWNKYISPRLINLEVLPPGTRKYPKPIYTPPERLEKTSRELGDSLWQKIIDNPENTLEPSDEDCKLLITSLADRNRLFNEFTHCTLDEDSGCWRSSNKESNYKLVMQHREAWFLHVHCGEIASRPFIYAHPDVPALVDLTPAKDVVRHHPFHCELFHQDEQHNKCCRPSHLAWGSDAANTHDRMMRIAFTRHLVRSQFRNHFNTSHTHDHTSAIGNEFAKRENPAVREKAKQRAKAKAKKAAKKVAKAKKAAADKAAKLKTKILVGSKSIAIAKKISAEIEEEEAIEEEDLEEVVDEEEDEDEQKDAENDNDDVDEDENEDGEEEEEDGDEDEEEPVEEDEADEEEEEDEEEEPKKKKLDPDLVRRMKGVTVKK